MSHLNCQHVSPELSARLTRTVSMSHLNCQHVSPELSARLTRTVSMSHLNCQHVSPEETHGGERADSYQQSMATAVTGRLCV